MRLFIVIVILALLALLTQVHCWRRRRRRRCVGCSWSSWGAYGRCSASCNYGYKYRYRSKRAGRCGAVCSGSYLQSARCYLKCCPVHCNWSWSQWSACRGCGISTQTSTVIVRVRNSCGGRACPTTTTRKRSCNTGICCPVNCIVNSWGNWGSCNAACEQTGKQVRTRSVRTLNKCGGTGCPTLSESRTCRGGCCRRDCAVSSWTSWSSCNAPSGQCGSNSGKKTRLRRVTRRPSCGGTSCPILSGSQRCTPVPITCLVSSWSLYGPCKANNGRCGAGTKTRTRTITRQPYCSRACPTLIDKRSCTHSCCPVNCVVSSWSAWTSCTATCGTGLKTRTRRITIQASCNGIACPSLKTTSSCTRYDNQNCVLSAWSSWSQCSNGCGQGMATKMRRVVSQPVCQGRKCGPLSASKVCTSYRENHNCVVSSWGSWGSCNAKCAVGSRQRSRAVTTPRRCRGTPCPSLTQTSSCGSTNGGCQHVCSNGVCSCRPGYNLASDKRTCTAKNCGKAQPCYCAQGTQLGSTCQYSIVTCPGGKTTYPVTCSLGCPKYYTIKGSSTITCQTTGRWSTFSSSYCRRNNDPPTQILLSGTSSVSENMPRGTKVGTFSSLDPISSSNRHTYRITKGGSGLFELRGADLLTMKVFNFEASPNTFDITVRSTDNGIPSMYLDKTFTIRITDLNEAPTDIQISSSSVNENSNIETTVGMFSTIDPDRIQSFTYQLLSSSGGRFKVVNNFIKVAHSNKLCLQVGGSQCSLNYEQMSFHEIRIRSTDSGSPSKSVIKTLNITINDVNDKPRDIRISNQKVKENAPINSVIGQLTAHDEDSGQRLVFSLDNNDNGRFKIDSKGRLLKAKATDYETSKVHLVTARATDNGRPSAWVSKQITIIVLNVNEAPVSVTLDNNAITENSLQGTKICTVTAHDKDAVQNLTFSLDDSAGGKFSFGPNSSCKHLNQGSTQCSTVLLVSGDLDFEDAKWETITIRVTDDKGLFHSKSVNITILDVNDKPTNITLDGSLVTTINENTRNLEIGELQTVDQDVRQTFTYTLLNNGGGNFEIRGNKLFVSKSSILDYENVKTYQVRVRSTDSGNPRYSTEAIITININNLNEKPTDITLSKNIVLENTPTGTVIGGVFIKDPDNVGPNIVPQTHTCQLKDSANGMIGIVVNQNVSYLSVGPAGVNYEANSTVIIIVQCFDPKGLSLEKSFKITVQDVNETPTDIVVSNLAINENQPPNTTIGRISAVDPDNEKSKRQSFTFSILASSAVPFAVRNGNLVASKKLDFESFPQWSFGIRVQDDGNPVKTRTESFTVQVVDINDQPTSVLLSSSAVNENSAQGTLVGILNTVDQDVSQNYTYRLIDSSNGRFRIDNNAVKVAQSNQQCLSLGGSHCALNYESSRQHQIRVRSTDDGVPALSVDTDLVIYIRDVNDQPRDLKVSNNRIQENAPINALVGQFNASDEDAGQVLSYSLVDDDGGRFKVDSSGSLYKAKSANYENQKQHRIRAAVTDNGSPPKKMEKVIVIEVLDINEAPVKIQFTSSGAEMSFPVNSARVKENSLQSTVVGTLVALDHDYNQTLKFILDDDGNGKFILSSTTPKCYTVVNMTGYNTKCDALLKLKSSLNYEKKRYYIITVRATDSYGLFTTQQFSIAVVDQNDAPTNISLGGGGSAKVNENMNGAFVGALVTTDEDTSQTFTYTLTYDAGSRFYVRGDKLFVSPLANLDFEKQSSYTVSIQANDSGSPSLGISKNFLISVLDVNEEPTGIALTNNHVVENSKPGTVIGAFNVTDPDNLGPQGARQSHVCAVVGSQIGNFVVQNNVLKLARANVDYEQASRHEVLVNCVDNGTPVLNLQLKIVVDVDDVNEVPSKITLSSNSVAENSSPSLVGTLSSTDPDNQVSIRQYFTYRLIASTTGLPFIIDGNNLNTTKSLDYETQQSWNLTVQSTDTGSPAKYITDVFTIFVIDINEQPERIVLSRSVVNENSGMDVLVGTLSSIDPDAKQKHTYTMIDTASGRFKISQNKLMVALSNKDCLKYGGSFCKLNFEVQQQHVIRIRTTDNGVPPQSNEKSFTIAVRDVNDRPRNLRLSGYNVKENATIGKRIGQLSAKDEDRFQVLSFSLVNDDNGRFAIDSAGYVVKAKNTDYETSKSHMVTVEVKDNGTQSLSLNKTFNILVENINEDPINITINSQSGQQIFPDDMPRVNENSLKGDVVGTVVSMDHDEVQRLHFKLVDDAGGKFLLGPSVPCKNQSSIAGIKSICSVTLLVNGVLNYEHSTTEYIALRVTDPKGLFLTKKFTVEILDVNDKPGNITISGGDIGYVDENANNALVGNLAAVDEDANQMHTFKLLSNGGWKFALKGTRIYTTRYANIDFEKQSSFTILVRAEDNGQPQLFLDKSFVIQVRDVNEMPIDISLTNHSVTENSPHGLPVGKLSVADPDDKGPRGPWQVHTCTVFNNVPFIVNQTTNELVVAGDLNHEVTQFIDVILHCYDNGSPSLFIEKTVAIKVMDENEAPTSIRLSDSVVAENSGNVTIGTLDTDDPDNLLTVMQTFSYSIVNGSGLPFCIKGTALKTTRSLDYENRATWEISIQSKDSKGLKVTRKFILTVMDRNDAPTAIKASGPLSVFENSAPGTYIGSVCAVDQDVGQTHTFQVESILAEGYNKRRNDSSMLNVFSIGSITGTILTQHPLNFEQYFNYTLLIRAVDNGSPPLSVTGYISIRVKDANEAPTAIRLSNNTVFENTPPNSVVGRLSVLDPDNTGIIWQYFTCHVTNPEQAPFKVVSDVKLAVSRNVLDFERQNIYSVGVKCSERISPFLSVSTTFKINILDINEPPYNLTISNKTAVPENSNPGEIVGLINVLDPDTPESGFANISLRIQNQSSSFDTFKIDGRRLVTTRPLDFEKNDFYQVTVVAMDSGNPPLYTSIACNVFVKDMNDPPSKVILNSSRIFENATFGTVVGTLLAVDQETKQTHAYDVISPTDIFSVNRNTLVLKNATLDYEFTPVINVTIKVTDSGQPPKSVEHMVSVNVLDSNDPPSDIKMTSDLPVDAKQRILVPENSPGNTPLANLFIVDQDISQNHTCMMLEGQKYFVIRNQTKSTAQVLVKDAAELDYESMYKMTINVTVRCTDSGIPQYSKNLLFHVTVSDVNESPYNLTLSLPHEVQEHAPKGHVIGNLSCQEPDFKQKDVFKVVGKSSKIFEVNQTSNSLVVKDSSYLDYEALQPNDTLTVSILATDDATTPLSISRDFIIHVTDINEAPHIEVINVTVKEDIARRGCIASINVIDPDYNQNITLSLLNYKDKFSITNTCNGASVNESKTAGPYLTNQGSLSYDNTIPDHLYDVIIEAKDDGNPSRSYNESAFIYVERVNPCDKHHDCNDNASCSRVNATSYKCNCKPGFKGDGRTSCVNINECQSNPCSPHGRCIDGLDAYTCSCNEGFSGNTSCTSIDYCASNPCVHSAWCQNLNRTIFDSNFKCHCIKGYTGHNCSVEINECDPSPCYGRGDCTDGINSFNCSCFEGYTGTQCQRSTKDCNPSPCKSNEVCVPRTLKVYDFKLCFDSDFVIPLYFKPSVFSLALVSTSHWKYQLQDLVTNFVPLPLKYLINDEAESSIAYATDLYVVETTILSKPMTENLNRERRSNGDEKEYTAVYFVVKHKHFPVPQYTFYVSLLKVCSNLTKGYPSDFVAKICNAAAETKKQVNPIPPKVAAQEESTTLHPYMYYVFIGIGAMVFLILLLGVALLGRNTLKKRELRALRIQDTLLVTDNFHTDIMYRHQLSNDGQGDGTLNPRYGIQGNVRPSYDISDLRLCPSADDTEDSETAEPGYSNPVYQTFLLLKEGDESGASKIKETSITASESTFTTPRTAPENPEEISILPRTTEYEKPSKKSNKKKNKKKKIGKKPPRNIPNDDIDAIPDIAAVNPMFQSGDTFTEAAVQDDSKDLKESLYAVPKRIFVAESREAMNRPQFENQSKGNFQGLSNYSFGHSELSEPIYNTPRKVTGAEEMWNPLYQGSKDQEEPFPDDIISTFSAFSTRTKTVGEDPGQSEC